MMHTERFAIISHFLSSFIIVINSLYYFLILPLFFSISNIKHKKIYNLRKMRQHQHQQQQQRRRTITHRIRLLICLFVCLFICCCCNLLLFVFYFSSSIQARSYSINAKFDLIQCVE